MDPRRRLRDRRHAALLTRARRGDERAFRRLHRELTEPLSRYVCPRAPSPEDAEDVLGHVFQRVVERMGDFDAGKGSVTSWTLAMARNALVDRFRRLRPEISGPELEARLAAGDPDPLRRLLRAEAAQRVESVLAACPPATREILALRYGQGLRFAEVARVLGLSEASARKRASRAVALLRAELEGRAKTEGEVDYAT
jgi:RNA polymerase sigma-70 factor (ECF subfamily)